MLLRGRVFHIEVIVLLLSLGVFGYSVRGYLFRFFQRYRCPTCLWAFLHDSRFKAKWLLADKFIISRIDKFIDERKILFFFFFSLKTESNCLGLWWPYSFKDITVDFFLFRFSQEVISEIDIYFLIRINLKSRNCNGLLLPRPEASVDIDGNLNLRAILIFYALQLSILCSNVVIFLFFLKSPDVIDSLLEL